MTLVRVRISFKASFDLEIAILFAFFPVMQYRQIDIKLGSKFIKFIFFKISVGECRLENMRTLCVACHSDVTAGQGADRRSTRAKARKQLKVIMNDLKKYQKTKETNTNIEVYSDEVYHFGEGGEADFVVL
jgi:cytochrome c553